MSQDRDQVKWEPMKGQMSDAEAQTLGIVPRPGVSYWAYWFFGLPHIVQREGRVITSMPKNVQNRALIGCGLPVSA